MTLSDLTFTNIAGTPSFLSQDYSDATNPTIVGASPDTLWGETNPMLTISGPAEFWITATTGAINGVNVAGIRQGAIEVLCNGTGSGRIVFIVFRGATLDLTNFPNAGSNECFMVELLSTGTLLRKRKSGTNSTILNTGWSSGSVNRWYKWRIDFWVSNGLLWLQLFRTDDAGTVLSTSPVTDNTNDFDTSGVLPAIFTDSSGANCYYDGWKGFKRA